MMMKIGKKLLNILLMGSGGKFSKTKTTLLAYVIVKVLQIWAGIDLEVLWAELGLAPGTPVEEAVAAILSMIFMRDAIKNTPIQVQKVNEVSPGPATSWESDNN